MTILQGTYYKNLHIYVHVKMTEWTISPFLKSSWCEFGFHHMRTGKEKHMHSGAQSLAPCGRLNPYVWSTPCVCVVAPLWGPPNHGNVPLRIIISQTTEIKKGKAEKCKESDKAGRSCIRRRVAPAWNGVHRRSKDKQGLNYILQKLLRTVHSCTPPFYLSSLPWCLLLHPCTLELKPNFCLNGLDPCPGLMIPLLFVCGGSERDLCHSAACLFSPASVWTCGPKHTQTHRDLSGWCRVTLI